MWNGAEVSFSAQAEVTVDRPTADAKDLADAGGLDPLDLELVGALHVQVFRGDLPPAGRPLAAATAIPAQVRSGSWCSCEPLYFDFRSFAPSGRSSPVGETWR